MLRRLKYALETRKLRRGYANGTIERGRLGDGTPLNELNKRTPQAQSWLDITVSRRERVAYSYPVTVNGVPTLDGMRAIVRAFCSEFDLGSFRWHGAGTDGITARNSQSRLMFEVGRRGFGQNTASSDWRIRSVGLVTFDDAHTIREHGLFSEETGGIIFDRTVIDPPINVGEGDAIRFEYECTWRPGA